MYSKGYSLSLNDGNSWWLSGDKDNLWWLDKFASILELKERKRNGLPRLLFSNRKVSIGSRKGVSDNKVSYIKLWGSEAGWTSRDYKSIRIWRHKSIADIICETESHEYEDIQYLNMSYSLYPIYRKSMLKSGLPLHGGLVNQGDRSVVLAAPNDTGKSTCCLRLPDHWKPFCDDETLVVLDKHEMYMAHPFPTWSDYLMNRATKTWNVQQAVPLSGVFFLEKSETDKVEPIGEGQASVLINESAIQVFRRFWGLMDKEDHRKIKSEIFSNACKMAKMIPAFRLRVSLHGRFWEEIERVL